MQASPPRTSDDDDVGGTNMFARDPDDLDCVDMQSKETRSHYRQCQKCWKRKADGVRLMVCSSCKITSYCSTSCQKADWRFHKEACKSNRDYREAMARQDELERLESHISGTRPRPSSLEVNQEMGEFLKRFRPVICQASYRCFGVQQGNSDAWRHNVFVLTVERIENPPRDSKPWARYRVQDAKAVPVATLLRTLGEDALSPTLKQGEVYHEENVRVGCVGTIMTFLECVSTGHQIRLVSWAGYGPEAWDDDVPCPDWKASLKNAVEKVSSKGMQPNK
ncbi:zinc finger MYND domain-containing protein [Phanerochaete sordida]|uniref:Zinc finger MYND domain-containing protein n=1 Tax=Phanerochaete sordida TaxID=48140 RepID=A0A9P3G096_9APHY|nr:zinc finger MYND domain-containing protein [Phanerochaete sordida]